LVWRALCNFLARDSVTDWETGEPHRAKYDFLHCFVRSATTSCLQNRCPKTQLFYRERGQRSVRFAMRTPTGRPLSLTELSFVENDVWYGYGVDLEGELDPDALQKAFVSTCDRYAWLSMRLALVGSHLKFVPSGRSPTVNEVTTEDVDLPSGIAFDSFDRLSNLSIVKRPRRCETSVILTLHHSMADAVHALHILASIWTDYTAISNGEPIDSVSHSFPRSLETILMQRGIHPDPGTLDVTNFDLNSILDNSSRREVRPFVSALRLTEPESRSLRNTSHRIGVSVHGLLSAAVLQVEAELRKVDVAHLIYMYPVDLRQRLDPHVHALDGTNVLGFTGYRADPKSSRDLIAIGRAINKTLHLNLSQGNVQRSFLELTRPKPETKPLGRAQIVRATNWGLVSEFHSPGTLHISNFRSSTRFTRPSVNSAESGSYVFSKFQDRLCVEFHWVDARTHLPQTRIDGIARRLRTFIEVHT
jgi:acetyltransferase